MRLLVDMNLTPRWAAYLSSAGHDAVHWSTVGLAHAKDVEICEYARRHASVVLTNDLDFPQILAHTGASGPSIVVLRGEPLVPEIRGPALTLALELSADELAAGAILSLDWSGKPRARLLPLRPLAE
jgi:predicted nuclease of predicted toxin-antitoxin system